MARMALWILIAAVTVGCASGGKWCDKGRNPHIGQVRHVVLFKFKQTTTPEQIKQVEQAFAALEQKIPLITGYEWGTNNSPEPFSQDYTHCFLVTFENEADRDAYLPHPSHQEFVQLAVPLIEEVHVLDYTVRPGSCTVCGGMKDSCADCCGTRCHECCTSDEACCGG